MIEGFLYLFYLDAMSIVVDQDNARDPLEKRLGHIGDHFGRAFKESPIDGGNLAVLKKSTTHTCEFSHFLPSFMQLTGMDSRLDGPPKSAGFES